MFSLIKLDVPFENVKIHNPSVKELFELFETEGTMIEVLQLMTMSLRDILKLNNHPEITEFQLFQTLALSEKDVGNIGKYTRYKMIQFLLLLFPGYNLEVFNDHFILKKDDSVVLISNSNFDRLKEILGDMFNLKKLLSAEDKSFNPQGERAKKIAQMIEEGRKKVSELKGEANNANIFETYLSILSVGFGIPPDTLSEHLTLYSLVKIYKRFAAKIAWDIDIKCRLAGGSPAEEPENWMAQM